MSARHPALAAPMLAQQRIAHALPLALSHAEQALPLATPRDLRPGVGDAADSGAIAPRARQGRERILAAIRQAAIAEFSRHGFKGTSTLAIAERAGLTKPQLHYYISSKEDLYEELLYSVLDGWSQAFSFGTTSDQDDPARVLAHYVRKKLDYALDQPELSRIFTNEVLSGGQHLGRYWPLAVQSTQHKVDLIEHWIAQGRMLPMDGHVLLMQIWGMTQHFADYAVQVSVMLNLAPNERVDREALALQLTNFVLRGCGLAPK
jgi:TetR/AcrR family transcriptional regulator